MPAPSAQVFDRLRQLAAIENIDARPTRTIDEVFTGKPLATIPVATAEDAEKAFAKARAAQRDWVKRPVAERAAVIARYRDLVLENREFLMDLLQAEAGKARWAAQEEIIDLFANADYYAKVAAKLLKPRRVAPLLPGITDTDESLDSLRLAIRRAGVKDVQLDCLNPYPTIVGRLLDTYRYRFPGAIGQLEAYLRNTASYKAGLAKRIRRRICPS